MRLCGLAVVELEQAADSLATLHLACADHCRLRRNELVAQPLVWAFFVIMVDKFTDGRLEMPFAQKHLRGVNYFCRQI
jgi:hypothetical protein